MRVECGHRRMGGRRPRIGDCHVWSWAENQVLAAIKTLPLGQQAGQRVLLGLGQSIAPSVDRVHAAPRDDRSNFAPALAILSAQHETQYSRLFRS